MRLKFIREQHRQVAVVHILVSAKV